MKLPLYFLRQILVAFAFATAALFLIAMPGITVSSFAKLGGVGVLTILGFIPLIFSELAPFLLPVAFLLAVLATFGRAAEDNEWIAVANAGVHPGRILVPTLALAALIGAGHYLLVSRVAPHLKVQQRRYMHQAFLNEARSLHPGRTELSFGPVHISARDREGNEFRDVLIYHSGEREGPRFVIAERAVVEVVGDDLVVRLTGARSVSEEGRATAGSIDIRVGTEQLLGEPGEMRMKDEYLDSPRLAERIRSGELEGKARRIAVHELHRRPAMSLAYVLFALLGAPTGLLLSRRGVAAAFLLTAVYTVAYNLLALNLFKELAHGGAIHPALAAWATSLILAPLGCLLVRVGMRPRR